MAEVFPNKQFIADHLIAIAGTENVLVDGEKVSVAPSGTEELAAIMRFADEHSLSVSPIGGGTNPIGGPPPPAAIHLLMMRLNAVKEHIWQDMTCTVEAGATWASMQSVLKQYQQFVALDPLWPDGATIGGVIATNDSGMLRLKYGSLRDLIIGMTIVLANGTIAKSGGKVVKNVAGYDLHKLMTGAFGTLGVIAEVTFRLHAIPAHTRSFTIKAERAEPLGELLLELAGSQLSLQSMQLRAQPEGFYLDVCLATMPLVLSQQFTELEKMAATKGLRVEDAATDAWTARQAEVDKASTKGFAIKAVMLPSAIAHFSGMVLRASGTCITQSGGIMTAHFENKSPDAVLDLRRELEAASNHLVILRQPSSATVPVWGNAPHTLPLMQKIKQRFDPNRILNPGHFLDDI